MDHSEITRAFTAQADAFEALKSAHAALRQDLALATKIGRKLFPGEQAELIAELIRRDLPYYDPGISEEFVTGMNQFARDVGILQGDVAYDAIVAPQLRSAAPAS